MNFDKVEEGALRLLEVFIKTDSDWLVEKLRLYEPSTSISSRQLQPFHVRFGVVHLDMVRNFLVFVSSLASSCNVQFMMLKL